MWTKNFQMYRLELEKAEDDRRARGFQKNIYSASMTMQKTLTVWITTNWKILKEMGTPDHHTCLLRNLHADHEATWLLGRVSQRAGWVDSTLCSLRLQSGQKEQRISPDFVVHIEVCRACYYCTPKCSAILVKKKKKRCWFMSNGHFDDFDGIY